MEKVQEAVRNNGTSWISAKILQAILGKICLNTLLSERKGANTLCSYDTQGKGENTQVISRCKIKSNRRSVGTKFILRGLKQGASKESKNGDLWAAGKIFHDHAL